MSYTQLSDARIIQVASEFVGLGYPIPEEIVAHLGPEIIYCIKNPGANYERDKATSELDSSSPAREPTPSTPPHPA